MIHFFRRLRRSVLEKKDLSKYFAYAIGEIILVVVGILLALQINNWNEERKEQRYEKFLLQEIATNLEADGAQIDAILRQRRKSQVSIVRMHQYLNEGDIVKDTLSYDLGQLFTFERYYPIRTAYELAKSNGLRVSDQRLRSSIANYYEYEQPSVLTSIKDIEIAFTGTFEAGYKRYALQSEYAQPVQFKVYPDPDLFEWVRAELTSFRQNHTLTLRKIEKFRQANETLHQAVVQELDGFTP